MSFVAGSNASVDVFYCQQVAEIEKEELRSIFLSVFFAQNAVDVLNSKLILNGSNPCNVTRLDVLTKR